MPPFLDVVDATVHVDARPMDTSSSATNPNLSATWSTKLKIEEVARRTTDSTDLRSVEVDARLQQESDERFESSDAAKVTRRAGASTPLDLRYALPLPAEH